MLGIRYVPKNCITFLSDLYFCLIALVLHDSEVWQLSCRPSCYQICTIFIRCQHCNKEPFFTMVLFVTRCQYALRNILVIIKRNSIRINLNDIRFFRKFWLRQMFEKQVSYLPDIRLMFNWYSFRFDEFF